jgi:phospholipase/carboxylesterase
MDMISRRTFVQIGAAAATARALAACGAASTEGEVDNRFTARPGTPTLTPAKGETALGLGTGRDGIMYVPASYDRTNPAALMVMLHGAGGSGPVSWTSYYPRSEAHGFILLAPSSRDRTWDLFSGTVGPDVRFIDKALAFVFTRCAIDTRHIALGGFSDGAGYAIALGLSNGDLFTHVIAHSPGVLAIPDTIVGKPRFYDSHGTNDDVLPYSKSSTLIVPQLLAGGYNVTFETFSGGHEIPDNIAESAINWMSSS